MRKRQLSKLLFIILFWVLGDLFYVYFEGTVVGFNSTIYWSTNGAYNFWSGMIASLAITIIASILIGSFEIFYFDKLLRKKPFGASLLIKTSFYLFNIFLFSSIAVLINIGYQADKSLFHSDVWIAFQKYLSSPNLILIMLYWSIIIMLSIFILNVNAKLGRGVLLNLLLGKYHRPKEETKIFMFLDLVSSTTIAEQLGTKKYSNLLRDFFYDIDEVIDSTNGAIFQFVGDEVVLFWDVKNGIKDLNCVRLFFLAEDKIKSLASDYLAEYGFCPAFKAGLHYGQVVVTEVGGSKQEIAYHGDAINTAARIRSACNNFNKKLLISKDLVEMMPLLSDSFLIKSIGLTALKGRHKRIELCSIDRNEIHIR